VFLNAKKFPEGPSKLFLAGKRVSEQGPDHFLSRKKASEWSLRGGEGAFGFVRGAIEEF
jgi:hypothetical protein